MKKKILLFILMFAFMTNVSALTFNVDVTNIEDEGNNGTIGSITDIDVANKEVSAYFQDIGDEVNFSITVTNTGDRAGTLREITFEAGNENIEYSSNLPEGGLAINGNDTNKVTVKAKVKQGAQNGKTTSEVKIKYTYDEGSCPDGEILSDDESMCLCPEGTERNEVGICVVPEKKIECKDDEIYNETKKICEKKVIPVTPSNPKTMDNIILITLLFLVSGVGIYAVLFRRLKTKKSKITAGVITGVSVLTLSFTVLAGVFGLDNLLGAIINPITKSKELVITVNEEIDLIETWDGDCDVTGALTPDNVFDGGSGTESDPYKIKTANQLACFAKSINEGETYEGKFIKQTKNIKLNDNLNDQATAGDLSNANLWTSAGYRYFDEDTWETTIKTFAGTYDGDNKIIKGLYVTNNSVPGGYKGLFGHVTNATFKNMELSDVYMNTTGNSGALAGYAYENLTIDNVKTYGTVIADGWDGAGLVSNYSGNDVGILIVTNVTNNIDLTCGGSCSGIIHRLEDILENDEPTVILRNNTNNGNLTFTNGPSGAGGLFGYLNTGGYVIADNCVNNGKTSGTENAHTGGQFGGIIGYAYTNKIELTNSYNTGDLEGIEWCGQCGMVYGTIYTDVSNKAIVDNIYNSGDYIPTIEITGQDSYSYFGGIVGYIGNADITNSFNSGDLIGNINYLAGIVAATGSGTVENCYNIGEIKGYGYVGGIYGHGGANISKTYNTGRITSVRGPMTGGIVGYSANILENSYNTGEIVNTGNGQVGGLCANYCEEVKNSYNRGNIIIKKSATNIGGITGYNMGTVTNVYNSGDIIYTNEMDYGNSGYVAGISADGGTVYNSYNLGNITYHLVTSDAYEPNPHADGIATYANVNNCVNTGDITIVADEPLGTKHLIEVHGISYFSSINSFNAGKLSLDDSALDTPVAEDGYAHSIRVGQITEESGSGNKFNSDPTGHATDCYGRLSRCTLEADHAVGVYTDEEAPSILSIINGDNAFNDELDEYGLPTLKVFNE